MWDTYPNIKLCVHCGVGRPGALRIESRARNQEYVRADNSAAAPPSKRVKQGGEDVIHTQVDIERAMEGFRRQLPGVDIEESTEAGLFLCEFS